MTLVVGDHVAKVIDGKLVTDEAHREFEVIEISDYSEIITVKLKVIQ